MDFILCSFINRFVLPHCGLLAVVQINLLTPLLSLVSHTKKMSSTRSVSNFRMPAQLALKQGQKIGSLNKLGEKVKNWKTRIFILMKTNLLYYKTAEDKHYTGVINLLNCPITKCDPSEVPGNMRHCLKIQTKTRTYYLSASSEQGANEWVCDSV